MPAELLRLAGVAVREHDAARQVRCPISFAFPSRDSNIVIGSAVSFRTIPEIGTHMLAKRGPRYARMLPLAIALLLGACSSEGILIPATDNPNEKLAIADGLLHDGRIMRARQQTEEAIAIFQRADDRAGLARAYREYGLVALYGGLDPDPVVLRRQGTPERPTPPEIEISDGYLVKARDLAQGTNQTYLIANIDWVLGLNEIRRGTPQGACPHLALAVKEWAVWQAVQDKTPEETAHYAKAIGEAEGLEQKLHCSP
jgi:hypothetical protein